MNRSRILNTLDVVLREFWNEFDLFEIAIVFPHDPEDEEALIELRFFEVPKYDVLKLAKLVKEKGLRVKVEPVEDHVESYVRVEVRA